MGRARRKKNARQQSNEARRDTWCIIASGPSLTKADCEKVKAAGIQTIVVNDNYRIAPWAHYLYACDPNWWRIYYRDVIEIFNGELWTQDKASAARYHLNYINSISAPGLSRDDSRIHQGQNSGYQALNLAYIWGAVRILLLGFDMQANTKTHWFGNHPEGLQLQSPFGAFIKNFKTINPAEYGIEIINCSPETALRCFPRAPIETVL